MNYGCSCFHSATSCTAQPAALFQRRWGCRCLLLALPADTPAALPLSVLCFRVLLLLPAAGRRSTDLLHLLLQNLYFMHHARKYIGEAQVSGLKMYFIVLYCVVLYTLCSSQIDCTSRTPRGACTHVRARPQLYQ
jgi:hypothetical protein